MNNPVATIFVDFNDGRKGLFDAIAVGDEVWAQDHEGMRCRATVTGLRFSEHTEEACILIYVKGDYSTLEDFEDGKWVPRHGRLGAEDD